MNKSAKILVTGGSGLIGSYLLRKLVDNGHQAIHAIHLPGDSLDLVADIKDKVIWHVADITDMVALYDLFDGVETVIHCAGMISFWPREFKEMYRVNVDGTATIVNLCLEHNVDRLIHISSIEAIGKEEDNSLISERTEWQEDTDHTKYGVSKYLGELEAWRGIAEGLDVIIYNPALVLGAGLWDHGPMKIVKDVYDGLKYYPKGATAIVDVRDLVDTILLNLENHEMYGNRYIVGTHNVKFKDLLDLIAVHLQVDRPSKPLTGLPASTAILLEQIRSVVSKAKPLINKETHIVSSQALTYSFDKINAIAKVEAIPLEKSIAEITNVFKATYLAGRKFGSLEY